MGNEEGMIGHATEVDSKLGCMPGQQCKVDIYT